MANFEILKFNISLSIIPEIGRSAAVWTFTNGGKCIRRQWKKNNMEKKSLVFLNFEQHDIHRLYFSSCIWPTVNIFGYKCHIFKKKKILYLVDARPKVPSKQTDLLELQSNLASSTKEANNLQWCQPSSKMCLLLPW